ncbi:hypothetical protein [Streptomyces cinnamoneus]|uniref:hypothetical protein n=1 Tax=Streptomyces cinnamoneus TaxID=53446 RepID=UPI0037B80924
MTAQEQRDALTRPLALHDHIQRRLRDALGELPPRRGHPLPAEPEEAETSLPQSGARAAVEEALSPLPDDPAVLLRRFARLGIRSHHCFTIRSVVADLPLPTREQREAARSLGRQLTRTGTTVPAVTTGIALLARLGEPEDVPYLSALGLLRPFPRQAVRALDPLDRPAAALVWLAAGTRCEELLPLVRALWARDRAAIRTELVALPASALFIGAENARRIMEATRLPALLADHPSDTALLARAGRLLVQLGASRDQGNNLLSYPDALTLYEHVVTRAGILPPDLDDHATLLSLALDLRSGPAALLDWPAGRRAALLESLGRLLAQPRWAAVADSTEGGAEQRLRAGWIRRTGRRPFTGPATKGRLRIEVVAGDLADRGPVETRILIDGLPVVPAFFARGPAETPEHLLDGGLLRARPAPHEVRLAEASCTEGCCGALYVTIRRDGEQVVWDDWRRPLTMPGGREPAPEPPAYRFDAAAYDAEVARAEADRSWSWPARTVARLIKAELTARPGLLARWDALQGWISSGFDDPDTTVVTFSYAPGLAAGNADGIPLQFRWVIPDDGGPPERQAAAALRRLAEEDPKTYGTVCGGSRERAEELGFCWPDGS